MHSNHNTLVRWLPLLIWMLLIFLVSHQPSQALPYYGRWDLLVKKGSHFLAYAILALFAHWAGYNKKSALTLVVAYALSDELHQRHISGRHGTVVDIFIDAGGALAALLALRLLPSRWRISR